MVLHNGVDTIDDESLPVNVQHPLCGHGLVWDLHLFGTIEWGCLILGGWDKYG